MAVEPNTPFGKMGDRLILPDEESARSMYFEGIAYLRSRGYLQYEISNFARRGYESRHNLKYWNCDPYLGFGVAAHSDFLGDRFGNSEDVDAYIRGENVEAERSTPTRDERANEFVMLQMRLCKGLDGKTLAERFGVVTEQFFGRNVAPFLSAGLLVATEGGYALTEEGMYVSNSILSDLLEF